MQYFIVMSHFRIKNQISRVKSDAFFSDHPSSKTLKKFYDAYETATDFGACCEIDPYLRFVNPETINVHPFNYTGEQWRSTPKGSKNGYEGGIRFVLDVESFAFAFMKKISLGFKIAFALPEDKQTLRLDGYMLSPGN